MPAAGYANALTRKRRSHSELESYPKCGCDLSIHAYWASHLTIDTPRPKGTRILDSQNRLADAELLQHR